MKCAKCAAEVPEGMAFCPACGTPVTTGGSEGAQGSVARRVSAAVCAALLVVALLAGAGAGAAARLLIAPAAQGSAQGGDEEEGTSSGTEAGESEGLASDGDADSEGAGANAEGSGDAASSSQAEATDPVRDVVAEAEARGLAVVTGTIMVFDTDDEVAEYQGIQNPNGTGRAHAVFVADEPVRLTGTSGDGQSTVSEDMDLIELATGSDAYAWSDYDGAHVTAGITTEGYWWRSDTSLPMGSVRIGNATFEVLDAD